ncbi:hypothetical protein DFR79_11424 [Halanaerobium saccharolyticum]|uniref:Uncharacterized protein n=1 Tax=Halanaerobium saccharolyticum TaxID=43595 RepID=A0A4R6LMI0_9FIRM|nr:hypothetical protein [Halanaerobium saccharolyticum]TDO86452.1 hypothetical protein DFR79_11424 [Halanaerobium saccharolyticum]
MKKLFIITTILVFSLSSISLAAGYSFDGGFIYTTLDPSNVNDSIEGINQYYQSELDNAENDPAIDLQINNFDKMDEFDSATGFWIGMKNNMENYNIGVNYETFSNEVEANL